MELVDFVPDLFTTTMITIPFMQLFLLIVVSTLLLLLGSTKLALLANYLFTFYWGFSVNFGKADMLNSGTLPWFSFTYLAFGLMIVMLILLSFRQTR